MQLWCRVLCFRDDSICVLGICVHEYSWCRYMGNGYREIRINGTSSARTGQKGRIDA